MADSYFQSNNHPKKDEIADFMHRLENRWHSITYICMFSLLSFTAFFASKSMAACQRVPPWPPTSPSATAWTRCTGGRTARTRAAAGRPTATTGTNGRPPTDPRHPSPVTTRSGSWSQAAAPWAHNRTTSGGACPHGNSAVRRMAGGGAALAEAAIVTHRSGSSAFSPSREEPSPSQMGAVEGKQRRCNAARIAAAPYHQRRCTQARSDGRACTRRRQCSMVDKRRRALASTAAATAAYPPAGAVSHARDGGGDTPRPAALTPATAVHGLSGGALTVGGGSGG